MSVETKSVGRGLDAAKSPIPKRGVQIGTLLGLTLVGLLALMWIVLALSTKSFWTYNNITNLFRQGAMIAILSIGETFVIITAGIDLSVGAVVGFTSYYRVVSHEWPSNLAGNRYHPCFRHSHRRLSRVWNYETGIASVYYDVGHADSSARCRAPDHEWRHYIDHKRHVYRLLARRFSRGTQSFLDGRGSRRSCLHLPTPKPIWPLSLCDWIQRGSGTAFG